MMLKIWPQIHCNVRSQEKQANLQDIQVFPGMTRGHTMGTLPPGRIAKPALSAPATAGLKNDVKYHVMADIDSLRQ